MPKLSFIRDGDNLFGGIRVLDSLPNLHGLTFRDRISAVRILAYCGAN